MARGFEGLARDAVPFASGDLQGPSLRILVVDDHPDAARSVSMLLQIYGHRTCMAHDGHQALAMAESTRPDAVLLDIGLPGMDGLQVARRIRATDWGRALVLLALTGRDQPSDRQQIRDAGFDEHLVKPVPAEVLLRKLAEHLPTDLLPPRRPGASPSTFRAR